MNKMEPPYCFLRSCACACMLSGSYSRFRAERGGGKGGENTAPSHPHTVSLQGEIMASAGE